MAFHLLRIRDIRHLDRDGKVLWQRHNLPNIFHNNGQEFLLRIAFNTMFGVTVPANYYLGLDNRPSIAVTDTLNSIFQEPNTFGYNRQPVASTNGFAVTLANGNFQAVTSIVTFGASGGTWGPVQNLFLATTQANTGYLLSSVALQSAISLNDGQQATMRLEIDMTNC